MQMRKPNHEKGFWINKYGTFCMLGLVNSLFCVIGRFRFAEIMQESIPVLREHIKEASLADLRVILAIHNAYCFKFNVK